MNDKTGGSAFPTNEAQPDGMGGMMSATGHPGMTLRDYFAAKAMQGMVSHWWTGFIAIFFNNRHLAEDAYKMADAMLKAREQ